VWQVSQGLDLIPPTPTATATATAITAVSSLFVKILSTFALRQNAGKQGRYVRIQLLDENYLSLAEVQVMGIDL
jgi:hypothetical protein